MNIIITIGIIIFIILLGVGLTLLIISANAAETGGETGGGDKPKPVCIPKCDKATCGQSDGCSGKCSGICPDGQVCSTEKVCLNIGYTICVNGKCQQELYQWVNNVTTEDFYKVYGAIFNLYPQFKFFIEGLLTENPFKTNGVPYVDFYAGEGYMILTQRQLAYITVNTMMKNYLTIGKSNLLNTLETYPEILPRLISYLFLLAQDLKYSKIDGLNIFVFIPKLTPPSYTQNFITVPVKQYTIDPPPDPAPDPPPGPPRPPPPPPDPNTFWPLSEDFNICNIFEQGNNDYKLKNLTNNIIFSSPDMLVSFFWTTKEGNPLGKAVLYYGVRRIFTGIESVMESPPSNCFDPNFQYTGISYVTVKHNNLDFYAISSAFIETPVIKVNGAADNNYTSQRIINIDEPITNLYSCFNITNWPEKYKSILNLREIRSGPWGAIDNGNDSQLFYIIFRLSLSYLKLTNGVYYLNTLYCHNWLNQSYLINRNTCTDFLNYKNANYGKKYPVPNSSNCSYGLPQIYMNPRTTSQIYREIKNNILKFCETDRCSRTVVDSLES